MLDELFTQHLDSDIGVADVATMLLFSIVLGAVISGIYLFSQRGRIVKAGFALTLFMLPAIISIIIMMVGSNVARAFSLAGAFSIIRFRSMPGEPNEIAFIFFSLAVGLGCGIGFWGYAVLFTVIMGMILILHSFFKDKITKTAVLQLKITVPENLNYSHVFDDILKEYTKKYKLNKVKTAEFGTLFELYYTISAETLIDQKTFIDRLRERNGNMQISLVEKEYADS